MLGLVVEEASNCYQLDKRLEERFRSAEFAQGTARQAIRRLETAGLVRPRRASKRATLAGTKADAAVYEATDTGIEHFRAWMWASVRTPPVREELLAKVALCRPQDLPRMVELVREAETVCTTRLLSLNFRVRSRRREMDSRQWESRMDLALSTSDHAWWDSRVKWLQRLRMHLEEELLLLNREAQAAPRQTV